MKKCRAKSQRPKPQGQQSSFAVIGGSAALARRMHYNCETSARFSSCKVELSAAKHFEARSQPDHAIEYLERLICEAKKLQLHLRAWSEYKPSPPIGRDEGRAGSA